MNICLPLLHNNWKSETNLTPIQLTDQWITRASQREPDLAPDMWGVQGPQEANLRERMSQTHCIMEFSATHWKLESNYSAPLSQELGKAQHAYIKNILSVAFWWRRPLGRVYQIITRLVWTSNSVLVGQNPTRGPTSQLPMSIGPFTCSWHTHRYRMHQVYESKNTPHTGAHFRNDTL